MNSVTIDLRHCYGIKALTATLRERVVKGTPREAQDAFDALQALAMVRFAQIRAGGGQKQMKR